MGVINVAEKVVHDNVHGYIHIPVAVMKNLVDTDLFQRLRHIEQTSGSLRSLFPGARHDRFSHSLGVYHFGCKAFESLYEQYGRGEVHGIPSNFDNAWWVRHYLLFTVACLLHDCAHAPFSHAYESYYAIDEQADNDCGIVIKHPKLACFPMARIDYEMLVTYSELDDDFERDFFSQGSNRGKGCGAPHEKMSALMVYRYFRANIHQLVRDLNAEGAFSAVGEAFGESNDVFNDEDLALIARMIIGCRFESGTNAEKSIQNCFISLLNSAIVDVDGLDYTMRDTANSGMNNWDVDYERIISAQTLVPAVVLSGYSVREFTLKHAVWKKGARIRYDGESHAPDQCEEHGVSTGLSDDSLLFEARGSFTIRFLKAQDRKLLHSRHDQDDGVEIHGEGETVNVKAVSNFRLNRSDAMGGFVVITSGACSISLCGFTGSLSGMVAGVARGAFPERGESSSQGGTVLMAYDLAYRSGAIGSIQNAVEARNMFHLWAYSHPHALYQTSFLRRYLLKMSAKYLCCKRYNPRGCAGEARFPLGNCAGCPAKSETTSSGESPFNEDAASMPTVDDAILAVLGVEGFYDPHSLPETSVFGEPFLFSRSTDDDMNALFKWVYYDNEKAGENRHPGISRYFREYFVRPEKKPLWKSYADYRRFFETEDLAYAYEGLSSRAKTTLSKMYYLMDADDEDGISVILERASSSLCKARFGEDDGRLRYRDAVVTYAAPNVKRIHESEVLIAFADHQVMRMEDAVYGKSALETTQPFYYVYADVCEEESSVKANYE